MSAKNLHCSCIIHHINHLKYTRTQPFTNMQGLNKDHRWPIGMLLSLSRFSPHAWCATSHIPFTVRRYRITNVKLSTIYKQIKPRLQLELTITNQTRRQLILVVNMSNVHILNEQRSLISQPSRHCWPKQTQISLFFRNHLNLQILTRSKLISANSFRLNWLNFHE